jgi:hypothetical protein
MPIDYSRGKIYKIVGNGKVYVGSTCERLLCQRLAGHRTKYNRWIEGKGEYVTSCDCVSDPECYIELLEMCDCSCIDELRKCEGKWIRDIDCVNRCVAGRTNKEYYQENKSKKLEYGKAYQEANASKIAERKKNHRVANIAEYVKKNRTYYDANRELILQKKREQYQKKRSEINQFHI